MKRGIYFSVIWFLLFVGVQAHANAVEIKKYHNNGVSFSYPANWKVSSDVDTGALRYIFVESPGNGIFIVQVYPARSNLSLAEYAKGFANKAKNSSRKIQRISLKFSKVTGPGNLGEGVKEDFTIGYLGKVLAHVCYYYQVNRSNKTAYLISQSANEDLPKVQNGFKLLQSTFILE